MNQSQTNSIDPRYQLRTNENSVRGPSNGTLRRIPIGTFYESPNRPMPEGPKPYNNKNPFFQYTDSSMRKLPVPAQAPVRGQARAIIRHAAMGRDHNTMQNMSTHSRSLTIDSKPQQNKRNKSIRRSIIDPNNESNRINRTPTRSISRSSTNSSQRSSNPRKISLLRRQDSSSRVPSSAPSLNKKETSPSTNNPSPDTVNVHQPPSLRVGSQSSEDTCLSHYTLATSKATASTAVASPSYSPSKSKLSRQPVIFVKEYATPLMFQSSANLDVYSKRAKTPKESSKLGAHHIYATLFGLGFLLFPAWIMGYILAYTAAQDTQKLNDSPETNSNPAHSRWKSRFINVMGIWLILILITALVVVITHPNWFPFKSKINTVKKFY